MPAGEETGARGAAICGGVAAGIYESAAGAVAETVTVERTHDPDRAGVERYRRLGEAFEQAREGLGPAWGTLMRFSGEASGE